MGSLSTCFWLPFRRKKQFTRRSQQLWQANEFVGNEGEEKIA